MIKKCIKPNFRLCAVCVFFKAFAHWFQINVYISCDLLFEVTERSMYWGDIITSLLFYLETLKNILSIVSVVFQTTFRIRFSCEIYTPYMSILFFTVAKKENVTIACTCLSVLTLNARRSLDIKTGFDSFCRIHLDIFRFLTTLTGEFHRFLQIHISFANHL